MNNDDLYHTLDLIISDMNTLVFNLNRIQHEIAKRRRTEIEAEAERE